MTALRSPRSAWLLVGVTPLCVAKLHNAGHALDEVAGHAAAALVAGALLGVPGDDGLIFALEAGDGALQLTPVLGVLEGSPRAEYLLGELQAVFAELFLSSDPFRVRLEVAFRVWPAKLAARQRQAAVGPPAIRGHNRLGASEQAGVSG
jgi:hypothetical protein